MFDSMLTRSTTVGVLMAWPHDDRAPLIDWMAEVGPPTYFHVMRTDI